MTAVPPQSGPAPPTRRPYPDIRDYAVIGDCAGCALVARDGSVDWCAFERVDADPVCCRLLDSAVGGYFSISPIGTVDAVRGYIPCTSVLETVFTTPQGVAKVVDFMVVGRRRGARRDDYTSTVAPNWLVRQVTALRGRVELTAEFRPSVAWRATELQAMGANAIGWRGDGALLGETAFTIDGNTARTRFALETGEQRVFVLAGERPRNPAAVLAAVPRLQATACAYWRELVASCRYDGRYGDAVRRGVLTLKLMTHAASGAIAAAATTSLPECIGGERNWDYRYCWLRDATLTLFALAALGYEGEADRFSKFLFALDGSDVFPGQIMYGVGGETHLDESTLPHLDGYRGSKPVRIGNAAYRQRQLDVFGEIMDWALLRKGIGWHSSEHELARLRSTAEFVVTHWREPEQGLWEMRNAPQHHVYGKIMSWVALDRAARLFGDDRYCAEAAEILAAIRSHGSNPDGSLRQTFGSSCIDAALLLAPAVDFPLQPAQLDATIAAVQARLQQGATLRRYDGGDGLPGAEGAFVACSFWLVDALIFAGRVEEARSLYEQLLALANDVGLYAEEIDPATGAFLGNFPQAFTHLALIHSATLFEIVECYGTDGLKGAHADRIRRAVEATEASRPWWARLIKHAREALRISSGASMLDLRGLDGAAPR